MEIDMDKINKATYFLKSLEDPETLIPMMKDRIDHYLLLVMRDYSMILDKAKDKSPCTSAELINCSLIIGFLLKTYSDRAALDETLSLNI